jgi:leader peptidase (prepilin peptidase)/N-methyltransferase
MVPVFSWLFLRGRCRKCKEPISPQYPIIEAANGMLYLLVFVVNGFSVQSILYCLLMSALLVLSVIDWRTYEIPIGINIFILCLGILQVITDYKNWMNYLAGFLCISILLEVILLLSRGRAIGGGDVKLMAAAGLLLGWKRIILAFLLGCILGSVIHLLRMKISGADRVLAMGPYLSAGIAIAALWGTQMLNWYLNLY